MVRDEIGITFLGLGTVGCGVASALKDKAELYSQRTGIPLTLRKVLVRDVNRPRPVALDGSVLTSNPEEALGEDSQIVVEMMGGEQPALSYIESSLKMGRHVVTANKEVVSKHWPKLLALAEEHGGDIHYEASVGGGIPIVSPLKRDLAANGITSVRAIINGTTNYILTRMAKEGVDFDVALKQAQALGYAEPDPTADIEAHDPVYKIAILASLAFRSYVSPDVVYREGVTALHARDFEYAEELGYTIKLLAVARKEDGRIQARVHPTLLPRDELLARVDGVLNAVQVEGDLVGRVLFQGPGAGAEATASAVIADILEAARCVRYGERPTTTVLSEGASTMPMADLVCRYYVRIEVADRPGVLAGIARSFGDEGVSIASVIQKATDETAETAELVVMTHEAREESMQASIKQIEDLTEVRAVGSMIRVED